MGKVECDEIPRLGLVALSEDSCRLWTLPSPLGQPVGAGGFWSPFFWLSCQPKPCDDAWTAEPLGDREIHERGTPSPRSRRQLGGLLVGDDSGPSVVAALLADADFGLGDGEESVDHSGMPSGLRRAKASRRPAGTRKM